MGEAVVAAIIGAVAAGAAGGVQAGQQRQGQKAAEGRAGRARQEADAVAASDQRKAAIERRRGARKRPDLQTIIGQALEAGQAGIGSTELTGVQGVQRRDLRLGGNSLLGG